MLNTQVKNTTLHLNGQNLKLTAKNGRNSKTPGLHLSATHGKETVGRLTASSQTQEGMTQLDLLLPKSPKPVLERKGENQQARRPPKLAPLELPEEVKESQRQKLKVIQQETKPAACKLDVTVSEPCTRKVKSCVKQRPVKAAVCSNASTEPLKAKQQKRSPRPQLTRCRPVEQNGDRHLEEVVCRGTSAPLRNKPTPPLLSPRIKRQTAHGGEVACQNPSTLQQETVRRRVRLSRAQCLEEDQCNSNTSTGGLSADEGKLAQGVQGKGQRPGKALRGQSHAGKGIKEPLAASWENRKDDCSQQSARCPLNRQSDEGGSNELDGIKQNASNCRLKKRKPLITKHNNAVPVECLQL